MDTQPFQGTDRKSETELQGQKDTDGTWRGTGSLGGRRLLTWARQGQWPPEVQPGSGDTLWGG